MRQAPLGLLLLGLVATVRAGRGRRPGDLQQYTGEAAIAACNRAIGSGQFKGGELGKLLTSRGVELKRKGDIDGAIADYTRAIALNAKDCSHTTTAPNTLRDKGDLDSAIADYGRPFVSIPTTQPPTPIAAASTRCGTT